MYSVADYLWMIADRTRVEAYAGALRALLRPGDRVLDLGAGFGFFSVLAVRAGASHVDAVDINPAVHLGPKLAAANGCAGRVAFHHADVSQLTLDRPADVLLMDVRGATPFGRRSLDVLIDARRRLLRKGGTIIAARDIIFVAPSRAPEAFRREVQAAHGQQDVALDPVERVVYDTPMRCSIEAGDLLAGGVPWLHLDYRTVERVSHEGTVEWVFERPASVEGLAAWFETDLGGGFGFSTSPEAEPTVYRQMFIPFRGPLDVCGGERLRMDVAVCSAGGEHVWSWRGWVAGSGGDERLAIDQNSLAELVIDPAALPDTSSEARPVLGPKGRAARALLAGIDGNRTVSDVAATIAREDPRLFPDRLDAVRFVGEWLARMDRLERGADG